MPFQHCPVVVYGFLLIQYVYLSVLSTYHESQILPWRMDQILVHVVCDNWYLSKVMHIDKSDSVFHCIVLYQIV